MSRARQLADSADLSFDDGTLVVDSANNRVGIGTSNPDQILHLAKSGTPIIEFEDTSQSSKGRITTGGSTGSITFDADPDNAKNGTIILFRSDSTEHMRIDNSGNLLVGTTSAGNSDTGVEAWNDGLLQSTRDGNVALRVNRKTSDGTIVDIQKDGTTAGSFSSNNNRLQIISGIGGDLILGTTSDPDAFRFNGTVFYPSVADATVDLGTSNRRFKDLYISNGTRYGSNNSLVGDFGSNDLRAFANNNILFATGGLSTSDEAMRIDSSGNLLVGTTSTTESTVGTRVFSVGKISATRGGGRPAEFNRLTSDGDIVEFRKDSTAVGSIGVAASNNLYIGGTASNHGGVYFADDGAHSTVLPMEAGSVADGQVRLGSTSFRWKDLYLSGGVYLGGTGSANYLDDYEEGTFNVSLSTQTGTQDGYYRKVGNLVTCFATYDCNTDTSDTNIIAFGGFPFTSSSTNNSIGPVIIWNHDNTTGNFAPALADSAGAILTYGTSRSGSVYIRPAVTASGVTSTNPFYRNSLLKDGTRITFTISYFTD